jgi:glycosyltransferase involved in cell wall biosynthesis
MLTVLIATRDGARTLPTTLAALVALEAPAGGWRLVVVDNGSRDGTPRILDDFRQQLPLTSLVEPRPGKNVALNRGLAEVAGDLVVFTDDDVVPRTDWLRQLRAAADARPEVTVLGGAILPRWEQQPPAWILSWVPLGPMYALLDPAEEGPIPPRRAFGPNLAIRAEVFARGYRFAEDIGPDGTARYAMGSEAELVRRLEAAGATGWHCPTAIVEHIIRPYQLEAAWLWERALRYGRGQYRLALAARGPALPAWLGVPRYLIRRLLAEALAVARARMRGDSERAFTARWQLSYTAGAVWEAWSRRHGREPRRPSAGRPRPCSTSPRASGRRSGGPPRAR